MENKFIHLLYVPTTACNMGCKYCYLEDNTKDNSLEYDALDTLKFAIKNLKMKVLFHLISLYMEEKLPHFLRMIFII